MQFPFGDNNLVVEPDKDAMLSHPRPDSNRNLFTSRLSELNAVDSRRLHYPEEKPLSGSIPRRNSIKVYLKKYQHNMQNSATSEFSFAQQQLEECVAAVARDGTDQQVEINLYLSKCGTRNCSSSLFFRPPRYELRHTPLDSNNCGDGRVSSNSVDSNRGLQEHWGKGFGYTRYAEEETAINEAVQRRLFNCLKAHWKSRRQPRNELSPDEFAIILNTWSRWFHSSNLPSGSRFI
ncbi:unnamed protein product [Phytophthora fragariaefolia]|uniref:Unnamed protein product n=1 Tax=Phytophthora fragariaefolia TaxID=1490495 RepID=A0A9W6Y9U5_9STRA|nr:unnamed protein product [Phytophthora fragariaefolia]